MTLPLPYIIEGYVYDSNNAAVDGATVSATDSTNPQGAATTTTDASGRYYLDIMNYADDGSTIRVYSSSGGEFKDTTFTLDVGHAFKNIDLTLAQGDNGFNLDSYLKSIQTNNFNLNSGLLAVTLKNFNVVLTVSLKFPLFSFRVSLNSIPFLFRARVE